MISFETVALVRGTWIFRLPCKLHCVGIWILGTQYFKIDQFYIVVSVTKWILIRFRKWSLYLTPKSQPWRHNKHTHSEIQNPVTKRIQVNQFSPKIQYILDFFFFETPWEKFSHEFEKTYEADQRGKLFPWRLRVQEPKSPPWRHYTHNELKPSYQKNSGVCSNIFLAFSKECVKNQYKIHE